MINSNILLITDNEEISKVLSEKLVLLRSFDEVVVTDFENAYSSLSAVNPSVVFLNECGKRDAAVEHLKYIKTKYPQTVVILVADNYDVDFIMSMYDLGIDDYILENTAPADILIKAVNALKQSSIKKNAERNKNLLINLGIISISDGFYTEKYANEIMAQELENVSDETSFLIVTYDELDRAKFVFEELAQAVKQSVRTNDVIIELRTGKFYIILENADINGAVCVFNKIKTNLNGDFRIKAGITSAAGKKFKELEQKASVALTDAMLSANDYCVYQEKEIQEDEWTLEPDRSQKDFKLFKQAYLKKLEKVITPVFYKLQNMYDGKLGATKIEQYTDESQCIFHLKNPRQTSRLTLVYPGFAKVVIYITHCGLDSPENKEIIMPLKQLDETLLTGIIESFIEDYKTCIDG